MKKLSDISTKNRKQELINYLKGKKYDEYVDTLEDMLKDPKSKSLIEDGFGGDLGNIQLKYSIQNISVKKLLPTQNEIGLDSSLKHGLTDINKVKLYFSNQPLVIKHPLVTFNGVYIIDGHHRWSEALCFNPNAKMVCLNYDGDMTPIQMLKATQGAIAASLGEIPVSKRKGSNIYDCTKNEIEKYIEEHITNEVIDEFKYYTKLKSKNEIIDYILENCIELINDHPTLKYAPERHIMPQANKAGSPNDKDSALHKMKNDKVLKVK